MNRAARSIALAAVLGVPSGVASAAFLRSLDWATRTRLDQPWLVWLLPVAGVTIGAAYHRWGRGTAGGTGRVVAVARRKPLSVPLALTPLVFVAATLGHLCGASVGREGVALQMSGSMYDACGRRLKRPLDDRAVLASSALAAGFGGMFGVPLTGVVFAVAVRRRGGVSATLAALAAAYVAYFSVELLGVEHTSLPTIDGSWTWSTFPMLCVAGATMGALARLYVSGLELTSRRAAQHVPSPVLRPALGAAATLALMTVVGRDYLGLSFDLATASLAGAEIDWWAPLAKIALTVVALGCGFHGGELVPLLVVGATAGSLVAHLGGGPAVLLVAGSFTAVFAAAAHSVATGVVLAAELFGWQAALPALVVCLVARPLAHRHGIYDTSGRYDTSAAQGGAQGDGLATGLA